MSAFQWLPPAGVPLVLANGRMNPTWYQFFWTLAELKAGGPTAPSVTEVASQAQSNAESLAVTVSTLQTNAIPGAEFIPPPVGGDGNPIP